LFTPFVSFPGSHGKDYNPRSQWLRLFLRCYLLLSLPLFPEPLSTDHRSKGLDSLGGDPEGDFPSFSVLILLTRLLRTTFLLPGSLFLGDNIISTPDFPGYTRVPIFPLPWTTAGSLSRTQQLSGFLLAVHPPRRFPWFLDSQILNVTGRGRLLSTLVP